MFNPSCAVKAALVADVGIAIHDWTLKDQVFCVSSLGVSPLNVVGAMLCWYE